MTELRRYGILIFLACFISEAAFATAGERIARRCYKLYLGANQECPSNCCHPCGSQEIAPNVRTVARFTLQRPLEPVLWYAGVPYYYGHTDRYRYCRYCHDVNYYYSCHCCVLIIETIHSRS